MSTLYVVLFAGCMNAPNEHPRYYNDLQLFGDIISTLPGVTSGSMTVMHSDGSPQFQFKGTGAAAVLPATSACLLNAIGTLAANVSASDRFVFVASNHGGQNPAGSYLWCWNEETVAASDFATACNAIGSKQQAYIFGQCHSGGFITPLAAPNRVILTGCAADEVTYSTSDDSYDEFLLRVGQSLQAGTRRLGDVFAAAKAADTQKETPQLSDVGAIGSQDSVLYGP